MATATAVAKSVLQDGYPRRPSDTRSIPRRNSEFSSSTISLDMLPVHPIPCMQGPFEESIVESAEPCARDVSVKLDAEARRRQLLDLDDNNNPRPQNDQYQQQSRWQQKPEAKFHPLWKLAAQISFGIHLIHKKLAKNDAAVVSLLQQHVNEVDGFIEDTTADFDLALRDLDDRIRLLSLPLEHNRTFNRMLCDKDFRHAIIGGNDVIGRILDRTYEAMKTALEDVGRGYDATLELAKFLGKLQGTMGRDQQLLDIFVAMRGNVEGWRRCFKGLRQKAARLETVMASLEDILDEISKRAGIASRRKTPHGVLGRRKSHDHNSSESISPSRRSEAGSPFDKPLPPEPPRKTLSTRSVRPQPSALLLPETAGQPARSSSFSEVQPHSHDDHHSSSPSPQANERLLSKSASHKRWSKSFHVPMPPAQRGGLNVTFAAGVKSPGPSTPNVEPAVPRRRSRSHGRCSSDIEIASDHLANAALIGSTSATPLTAESERRPSLAPDQPPPSSVYLTIGPDEEVMSKNYGDRPASTSQDILSDGQERTPREEVALVLRGLGHELLPIAPLLEESRPTHPSKSFPLTSSSSSIFSNPSPFGPSKFDSPSDDCSPIHTTDVATSALLGSDCSTTDENPEPRSRKSSGKLMSLPCIDELGESLAIQSNADSIPLEGIPLSIEATEAIKSIEEDQLNVRSEGVFYKIPPKIIEFSPARSDPPPIDVAGIPPPTDVAASSSADVSTSVMAEGQISAHDAPIESSSTPNSPGHRRSSESSPASRSLPGEKVQRLVGVFTSLTSQTQQQTRPVLQPLITSRPTTNLSPVQESIDSDETPKSQHLPILDSKTMKCPTVDSDAVSPSTSTKPNLSPPDDTPTTPVPGELKLNEIKENTPSDSKLLDIWDNRDSIVKTPPGYVRRDHCRDFANMEKAEEDTFGRPQSFYLDSSREGSFASVIEAEDEALILAVTIPLPPSRPGSSISIPRIVLTPEQDKHTSRSSLAPGLDHAQSPDSCSSAETICTVEATELTSAPPMPLLDLDLGVEMVASSSGGVRVPTPDSQMGDSAKTISAKPSQTFEDHTSMQRAHEIQMALDRRDSGQNSTYSKSDASETVRVAVDMMPSFWPGQDRDSLLLDIGLIPSPDLTPNTPAELPETKEGSRIPVETDEQVSSASSSSSSLKNFEYRNLPKIQTTMATASLLRNVVETNHHIASQGLTGTNFPSHGIPPPTSHPISTDDTESYSPSEDTLKTSSKVTPSTSNDNSPASVKTIRSEPDLRSSALLDASSQPSKNVQAECAEIRHDTNSLCTIRPDSQCISHIFGDPELSQSSSPTVSVPWLVEEKSQRGGLFAAVSGSALFAERLFAKSIGRSAVKLNNGSTSTLPSYFHDSSPNLAETLYTPKRAATKETLAGEEADELSDETTALPRMLTSPEFSAIKKHMSIKRPNLNNLKGLSQRGFNSFLKKAPSRKHSNLDSSRREEY